MNQYSGKGADSFFLFLSLLEFEKLVMKRDVVFSRVVIAERIPKSGTRCNRAPKNLDKRAPVGTSQHAGNQTLLVANSLDFSEIFF